MLVRVLGSGGDGGVPRWDCGCPGCAAARAHQTPKRTHASVALSADGEAWLLIGATPDVLRQVLSFDALHPRPDAAPPLVAVAVRSAAAAEAGGLAALGSAHALAVYAPAPAQEALAGAAPSNLVFRDMPSGAPVAIAGAAPDAETIGLTLTLIELGGATAWLAHEPATERTVLIAPALPFPAVLPPEAADAGCVLADAKAAPRLPAMPAPHRYLFGAEHDDALLLPGAPRPAWALAHDGLDLFV